MDSRISSILLLASLVFSSQKIIHASWAEETLQHMTLREKIGQLFVIAAASCFDQPEEALASMMFKSRLNMSQEYVTSMINEYQVGGIIFLFKSTPEKQIEFMNYYYSLSTYPMWTFQDCEWGLSMRLYDTMRFPKNMTLGAIQDDDLLYELGKEIGRQCKVIGVDVNLAPVIDVNNNAANPVIFDRSFGEDKNNVTEKAIQMMLGMHDAGILTCAKHFPGHGDTAVDSHFALPIIYHDKLRLHEIELFPFKKIIAAGVPAIMTAHLHIPVYDVRANSASSLSSALVTDLLQKELGFAGLIITDGLCMDAVTNHVQPGELELQAYLAGNDILLAPIDVVAAVGAIERALRDGRITLSELDRRVLKILRAKERLGVHNRDPIDVRKVQAQLHTPDAYALKKRLFQEAITLVGNGNTLREILPCKKLALVQIGGVPESIFVQIILKNNSCSFFHVPSQTFNCAHLEQQLTSCDSVIVGIFDMNKFAAKNYGLSNSTLKLLSTLREQGKKFVVTLFGNPYSLKYFNQNDVVIVAYEDDSDAQEAAAHVLLGNLEAHGKLPVTASYELDERLKNT